MSPSQGNSTSPGCAAQEDEGVPLAAFLLGLGTVDSLHWAEAGITIETGVSAWADQGPDGNDIVQAVTAAQPLVQAAAIGGKPAIRSDGTDDFITGSWARPQPYTGLVVAVPSRAADSGQSMVDGAPGPWMLLDTFNTVTMRFFAGIDNINAASDIDAAQLLTYVANGASSSLTINDGTPVTGNGTSAPGGLTLGARAGGSQFADCDIGIIVIYTAITAPKLAIAQALLSAYYSLGF